MKKVLIASTHFWPYIGGLEKHSLELAKGLNKNKIKTDIMTFQHNKSLSLVEKKDGVTIYRLPCFEILGQTYTLPNIFNLKYYEQLKKIKKNNYDTIFTNTRFFYINLIAIKISKKLKAEHIHIEHGNIYVKHPKKIIEMLSRIWDETLGKKIFRNANLTVGISKKCSEFAKKQGAKNTITIHNSIHADEFNISRKKHKKFVIGYVGRLIHAKGIQHLIKACNGLNVKLLIIGDGPYLKELKELSIKNKVEIKFTGNKKIEEIKHYLAEIDLFVNPSYSEGLPTSVLEAGAAGIPIIATDVGGTNEIIDHKENGFLIKPKNERILRKYIKELQNNKKTRDLFSKNIKEKVKKEFEWNKNIKKFIKIIEG